MKVIVPYKPRPQFLPYHNSDKRFAVSVCHRRAGKTVARVNKLIRKASENTRQYPPPRYGYLAPYFVQAKDIAWPYLKYYAGPLVPHGAKINESELSVTLPDGQTIRLYGAENAERMRGIYFDGIEVDEAQGVARSVLTQIILPCLADYRGWLDIAGTPRGWQNLLGEIVKLAQSQPNDWFLQIMRASESGIIPGDELGRQRALMSANEYAQEFECDFDAAITGAVYGQQIVVAAREGRLLPHLEHIATEPVHTAWDVGFNDSTAIWWWQRIRGELRILDYYESFGYPIEHYCEVIRERGAKTKYIYGKHYVPHDAGHELLAAGGRSIVEQANALGVKMVAVPATSQQNGIEAARKTLESCHFDAERCERGLECLRQYQFEFDERLQTYRDKPRHDKYSHGADAFEIIGQVWRDPEEIVPLPQKKFFPQITYDELLASVPDSRETRI